MNAPTTDTMIATHTRPDGATVTLSAMAPTTWRRAGLHVVTRHPDGRVERHTEPMGAESRARAAYEKARTA